MKSATDINYHPTPNMPSHSFQVFIVPLQVPDPTMTSVSFVSPSEGPEKGSYPRSTAPKPNCRKPFKKNILSISLTTQRSENQLDISWFVNQQKVTLRKARRDLGFSPYSTSIFFITLAGQLYSSIHLRFIGWGPENETRRKMDQQEKNKQKFNNTCVCTGVFSAK